MFGLLGGIESAAPTASGAINRQVSSVEVSRPMESSRVVIRNIRRTSAVNVVPLDCDHFNSLGGQLPFC